ncbi:DNA polymerase III subunit gamma/tau [Aureibaculum sp. A20]|uniref:DNA polymerase III subunit gamma/tau n=1 Tax=Aureibaculum flavum TaxID=2795986 RepID=A0ABS0WT78_9FLAO|nr:DNA polymerase III subunit gamma/tau [Aureibaculum flavum]MBJ2175200.1 DNA polymerase III subunit gamma/tau [Aureibaculum flavum]
MEHFIVSARKYRPQVFDDVVGQKAITNTLENAIKNNHLAQALLFTGPRGVGKTTCARILAKRINQANAETIDPNEDFAFNIFELDAASNNSVDDIRNLTDQVRIPPQTGKYKVYIIDEVHMLSQAAFNAFLKTLEEPPAHAIFILATTEKHKIIPTILSRCQIFDFKRIGVVDIKEYLHKITKEEKIEADDDALHIIAQKADGALRDALSIFDRVVSFSNDTITRQAVAENLNVLDYDSYFKITDLILENNIPQVLIAFNEILAQGFEGHHFIAGLASHYRDLLVAKDSITIPLLEVGESTKKQYDEQSKKCEISFLLKGIDLANDCDLKYKSSKNQRLLVELTLMQLASITFPNTDEKKKHKNYIIPAIHFISTSVAKKNKVAPVLSKKPTAVVEKTKIKEAQKTPIEKPTLSTRTTRRSSALSLKSIHKKKETVKKTDDELEDNSNKPRDEFSEAEFLEFWKQYIEGLEKKGVRNLVAILKADIPKVKKNSIQLDMPSAMMKTELLKVKPKLVRYFREKLNNYGIDLVININEDNQKKFAYTPQEKYNKLLEKNQALALLKSKFKLDL